MTHQIIQLNCPNCGDTVDTSQKYCKFCKQPIIISTFNSIYSMPPQQLRKYTNNYESALAYNPGNQDLNLSLAMCYLKLKLYKKATELFERAIQDNFDNSEAFFYASVSLLEGKKAFLHLRPVIDKVEEFINAAIMIEPRGIYHYFWAYIKYDYFYRKAFITSPTYQELAAKAHYIGFSEYDVIQLFTILGVTKPEAI